MKKLEKLVSLCKSSVHITYNEHTANYETVHEYLHRHPEDVEMPGGYDLMVKDNRVVEVQFYPRTPIGFYRLTGHNLDKLLDEAIAIAEREASS